MTQPQQQPQPKPVLLFWERESADAFLTRTRIVPPGERARPFAVPSGLRHLVDGDGVLEEVLAGFKFLEGPAWHTGDHHLTFSDITGNSLFRYTPATGSLQEIRPNSHLANGNTYDPEGRLLTCHHATSRVTRAEHDGTVTVLASHYEGKALNSPNDIVVRQDGAIYFTDPLSGREPNYGVPRESEVGVRGVYRLDPNSGALTLLVDDFVKPNGLCFSRDERRLFINDTARRHIRVFDVRDDGTLANGTLWAEVRGDLPGVPDGMKIDADETLYCCGSGGVQVFSPAAELLGVLPMPQFTANFCWGGHDGRDLYFTASRSVYRLRMRVPGLPTFGSWA